MFDSGFGFTDVVWFCKPIVEPAPCHVAVGIILFQVHVAGHSLECSEIVLRCKMIGRTCDDKKRHWQEGIWSGMVGSDVVDASMSLDIQSWPPFSRFSKAVSGFRFKIRCFLFLAEALFLASKFTILRFSVSVYAGPM